MLGELQPRAIKKTLVSDKAELHQAQHCTRIRHMGGSRREQNFSCSKIQLLLCELTCRRGYKAGRPPFITVGEEDKESISALLQIALSLCKCNQVVFNPIAE